MQQMFRRSNKSNKGSQFPRVFETTSLTLTGSKPQTVATPPPSNTAPFRAPSGPPANRPGSGHRGSRRHGTRVGLEEHGVSVEEHLPEVCRQTGGEILHPQLKLTPQLQIATDRDG